MVSSLIRGKHVICKIIGRDEVDSIEDGAIFQRDGWIVEIGKYDDLAAKHQPDEVIGSDHHVVIPGLINAHHHIGLTPIQLGSLDQPLELWFATRLGARDVNPYLDTLYSAFEMIESGVTTVQHIRGFFVGGIERNRDIGAEVLQAYADIGMRVSYAMAVVDQNRMVYEADEDFLTRLPDDLAAGLGERFADIETPLEDQLDLFREFHRTHLSDERVGIQLAPANLHWCSDRALEMLQEESEQSNSLMHVHLAETAYQKEYARRRTGTTALRHLHSLGMLGPRLTLGHGVWLTEDDIELAAETGVHICHNCSSNLRLRSGIAPLNDFHDRGIPVAIGIDEAGINDDRDMLLEMRMVLKLHRGSGMDDRVPTSAQVFRMATENGAMTTPFGSDIGTIETGKAADLVLLDWRQIAYPYLDDNISIIDAILHRAKTDGVDTVLVAGEAIYKDRTFARIDKDEALKELAAELRAPLKPHEVRRRALSNALFDHVKTFYDDYLEDGQHHPFDRRNSRI